MHDPFVARPSEVNHRRIRVARRVLWIRRSSVVLSQLLGAGLGYWLMASSEPWVGMAAGWAIVVAVLAMIYKLSSPRLEPGEQRPPLDDTVGSRFMAAIGFSGW